MKRALALPFLLALSVLVRADKVDDLVRAEMVKSKSPGLSIAVVKDGKVIRAQGYGLANIEHNVPVTPDTVFRVASMSKQFCAASVMLLVEEGKASLTDSIRKYLPAAPASWEPITLKHVLNHTSGMPDVDAEDGFSFETTMSNDTYLKILYSKPLKYKPGEKFEYSNPGYSVLGLIVGKIAGKSMEEFVAERIWRPLGMSSTFYYSKYGVVPNRAAGYARSGNAIENALFLRPSMMQGSGGVISTVNDYAKWDIALHTDFPLSRNIRDQIWADQAQTGETGRTYGFGWFLTRPDGKLVTQHSGGTVGFTSNFIRHVDDKLTVIVLQNVASGGAVALSQAIAEAYLKGEVATDKR